MISGVQAASGRAPRRRLLRRRLLGCLGRSLLRGRGLRRGRPSPSWPRLVLAGGRLRRAAFAVLAAVVLAAVDLAAVDLAAVDVGAVAAAVFAGAFFAAGFALGRPLRRGLRRGRLRRGDGAGASASSPREARAFSTLRCRAVSRSTTSVLAAGLHLGRRDRRRRPRAWRRPTRPGRLEYSSSNASGSKSAARLSISDCAIASSCGRSSTSSSRMSKSAARTSSGHSRVCRTMTLSRTRSTARLSRCRIATLTTASRSVGLERPAQQHVGLGGAGLRLQVVGAAAHDRVDLLDRDELDAPRSRGRSAAGGRRSPRRRGRRAAVGDLVPLGDLVVRHLLAVDAAACASSGSGRRPRGGPGGTGCRAPAWPRRGAPAR